MCLHILAMVTFEKISWGDAAWLTITTATTVGYGDISAATNAGRWSTAILMYTAGIFILAQLAGLIFEASQYRITQRLQGKKYIRAKGHIVIFGWHENFVTSVVQEIRESITPLGEAEIIVVSPHLLTLPDGLREADVHHVNGAFFEAATLEKISLSRAARVVLIPDRNLPEDDFVNLDLLDRLKQRVPQVPMIMACQRAAMLARAQRAGASQVLTFSPNYPDVLTRAILALGAERVVEELINPGGAEMIVLAAPVAATIAEVVAATDQHAVLLGYQHDEGNYIVHPQGHLQVNHNKLIFLIDVAPFGGTYQAEKTLKEPLVPYFPS
ncbi:MAG: potassium channel family protein [Bacteroidota bacterium]